MRKEEGRGRQRRAGLERAGVGRAMGRRGSRTGWRENEAGMHAVSVEVSADPAEGCEDETTTWQSYSRLV